MIATSTDLSLARAFHYSQKVMRLVENNVPVISAECPTCMTELQFSEDSAQLQNELNVCCPYCKSSSTPKIVSSYNSKVLLLTPTK